MDDIIKPSISNADSAVSEASTSSISEAPLNISDIPVQFHAVVLDGSEWMMGRQMNNPNTQELKQAYEFSLQKMIEEESAFDDYQPVLQPSDGNRPTRFIPFPTTFEQPS